MKLFFFALTMSLVMFTSCNPNKNESKVTEDVAIDKEGDDIVAGSIINMQNQKLEYAFNRTQKTATFIYEGDTIKMVQDTLIPGNSNNFKNDHFNYAEVDGEIVLTKDGKTIFYQKEDIVSKTLTDKEGKQLNLKFNNTRGIATFDFEGQKLELTQDTVASGIKYSNKDFVYTEHQGNIDLTKDGKTVFSIKQ